MFIVFKIYSFIWLHWVLVAACRIFMGFPGGSVVKNHMYYRRLQFDPWVGKIPLEKEVATHSSILARRLPMDRGISWTTVSGVTLSQT